MRRLLESFETVARASARLAQHHIRLLRTLCKRQRSRDDDVWAQSQLSA